MKTSRVKRGLIRTNRLHLVRALGELDKDLPKSASIQEWCSIGEMGFMRLGIQTYCHTSAQIGLRKHAVQYSEIQRFDSSLYHCDMQHDIAFLNKDTDDPSGANSDPMFPRETHWIFSNEGHDTNIKQVSRKQLEFLINYYSHVHMNEQFLISSDGHKCLSTPEFVIEEFFISHGVRHIKEGDIDKSTSERATRYPFDEELNAGSRGMEADWIIYDSAGGWTFVEYFEGSVNQKQYKEKVEKKKRLAEKHNIPLISLYRPDVLNITRLTSTIRHYFTKDQNAPSSLDKAQI